MLISIDWIKDFVTLPNITANELGSKFTLATAEVEDVISSGEHFERVHVAFVKSIRRHPEADKLNLVTLQLNAEGKELEVVCGASNVRPNLKVCFAPNGTSLPNGITLEPKVIRGVKSEGMICSEEELGLADSSEGIIELPADAPIGQNMVQYMKKKRDVLLEIDNKSITHRPDLWGHFGMAREFATIFSTPLKNPFSDEWMKKMRQHYNAKASPIHPVVDTNSACLGYFGLSVENVKVQESPDWIKERLIACGLRPINSLVDISNYVMLELGFPLHIFDAKKIKGNKLFIHRIGSNQDFITLDEQKRSLIDFDTVIADEEKPLVLGGIMGGLNSGVCENTTSIFIEVANWKAAEVRRTSTRLGLRTDSSQRYEKTLDSCLMERTLLRTLELVLMLNPSASVVGKAEYSGIDLSSIRSPIIATSVEKIEKVLGINVGRDRIISIFKSLDFAVEENAGKLIVSIPTYRATKDISCQDDLIEEIGRIVGYDNITPVSPVMQIAPVRLSETQKRHRKIRDFLSNHSAAYEVMTYPMIGEKTTAKVSWPVESKLVLVNALSEDADRMRPSMIPSILQVAANNTRHFDQYRFFEVGRSYIADDKKFASEENHLVICFYHREKNCFLELQDHVERLLTTLSVSFDFCEKNSKFKNALVPEEWSGVHPYEYANIRIMGKMQGAVFSVHPMMLKELKIKGNLTLAVINLSSFETSEIKSKVKYRPLPKFPMVDFDCTVVANRDVPAAKVLDALKAVKMKECSEKKIVTVFPMENGQNAISLRVTFYDPSMTLGPEVIKKGEMEVLDVLAKAGFPLRS